MFVIGYGDGAFDPPYSLVHTGIDYGVDLLTPSCQNADPQHSIESEDENRCTIVAITRKMRKALRLS